MQDCDGAGGLLINAQVGEIGETSFFVAPEPATGLLVAAGLLGLAMYRRGS